MGTATRAQRENRTPLIPGKLDRIFLVPPESRSWVRDKIERVYRTLRDSKNPQYPLLDGEGQLVLGEEVRDIALRIVNAELFGWKNSAICPELNVRENRSRCLGVYHYRLFDILDKRLGRRNDQIFIIAPSQTEIVVSNQGLPVHDVGYDVNYSGSSIVSTAQTFYNNPITWLKPLEKRDK